MSGRRCAGGGTACAGAVVDAVEPAARELFEACRNGDVERVKRLVTPEKVNSRDTAGRKSTPLHFAAVCYKSYLYDVNEVGQVAVMLMSQDSIYKIGLCLEPVSFEIQKSEVNREIRGPPTTKKATPGAGCILCTRGSCAEKLLVRGKTDDKDLPPEPTEKAFPWSYCSEFGLVAYKTLRE